MALQMIMIRPTKRPHAAVHSSSAHVKSEGGRHCDSPQRHNKLALDTNTAWPQEAASAYGTRYRAASTVILCKALQSLLARLLMEAKGDRRICALPDLLAHLGEVEAFR